MPSRSLRCLVVLAGTLLWAAPGFTANAIVKDGNTIQLADVTYRLDGIDAPELDQTCIDDHAVPWSCGVDARDQLAKLVGGHLMHCEDRGPDPATKKRHLGICSVEGETISLNQALVRLGFAMIPGAAKAGFADDEASARSSMPSGVIRRIDFSSTNNPSRIEGLPLSARLRNFFNPYAT